MTRTWRELFRLDWPVAVIAGGIALIIGCAQALGVALATDEEIETSFRISENSAGLFIDAGFAAALAFVLLVPLYNWIRNREAPVTSARVSNRQFFVISMLVMVVAWLPYLSLTWPGHATGDSFTQIKQALGLLAWSDHHPIFMTLSLAAGLKLFVPVTGSISAALGVMSGIQLVVTAAIFAHSLTMLRRFNAPGGLYVGVVVFLAVNPVIGWYSVSTWKDVWMGAFVLWAAATGTVLLADLKANTPIRWYRWAGFGAQLALICAAKKNGSYMVLVLTLVLVGAELLRRKGSWGPRVKQVSPLAATMLAGLLGFSLLHGIAMAALNATPGSPVEAYSVPVQQMARVVKYHGDELSDQQRAELDLWFGGKDIGELYVPTVSDNIKGSIDRDVLAERGVKGLLGLWWSLVSEHPKTALLATLEGTRGYWYPGIKYWMVSIWNWPCQVEAEANENSVPISSLDPTLEPSGTCFEGAKVDAVAGINEGIKSLPWLSLLFSPGIWAWACLVLTGALVLLRRYVALAAVTLAWLVWGTCMISPVFAESRYAYPMLLLLPVLLLTVFAAAERSPSQLGQHQAEAQ